MCQRSASKLHVSEGEKTEDKKGMTTQEPKAPYFFYRNFSDLADPDPSKPITATGRIPNFPAKMMSILSRPDLAHIISWMPHGRGWRVHKPREFEVKVIPTYFEHSKFSSFIRQANGWGFRRMIGKSPDRNSYYHELFLRGRPHLLKLMKRPTSTTRPQADANTEPDFYRIAKEFPLPEATPEVDVATTEEHVVEPERYVVHDADSRHYRDSRGQTHSPLEEPKAINNELSHVSRTHWQDAFEPVPVHHFGGYYARSNHHEPCHVVVARALTPVESHTYPPTLMQTHHSHVPMVARAVSPVQSHFEAHNHEPLPVFVPRNEWTQTCLEPREMPKDFEDPFSGGLRAVDFW